MCCRRSKRTGYKKFLPGGVTGVFHKTGGNFLGENFPQIFRGKCRDTFFSGKFSCKSFPRKYRNVNFTKDWFTGCNQLYAYKLLVLLRRNFVEKISRRETFGKSRKLPDGKISPREFSRHFRVFSENRSVNRCEKAASGEFREIFSTVFSEIPGKTDRKLPVFGKFPDKFPSEILEL